MIKREKQPWKKSVVRHAGAVGTITGVVIAVIGVPSLWLGEPWRAQYGGWAVVNGAYVVALFYLIWLNLTRPAPDFLGVPKVRFFKSGGLLLVEHAPWLSLGVLTAIYVMEDKLERLVCVGEIINVQSNGLVQIQTHHDDQGYGSEEEAWDVLERTDKELILVKPGLYRRGS